MEIKKSSLIVVCVIIIIFLNERMFYMLEVGSSIHVMGLFLITVTLFLVYIKSFFTKKFLFKGVILFYLLLNITSLILTNVEFGQPIFLALMRYKYTFLALLYFPLCIMIYKVGADRIKKLIVTITSLLSFIYISQSVLYPTFIFLKVNYAERYGFTRFYDGAYFVTIGLFITISYLYKNYNRYEKFKYYIAFLFQISYIVFVAQTRSSIIPILIIIIFLLLSKLSVNNVLSYFKVAFFLFLGVIILAPYVTNILDSIKVDLNRTDGSAYIRIQAKEYMKEKIKENPILGLGLYHGEYEEGKYLNGSIYKYYAEDVGIIGFIFQYGFVGLLLYIVMIARFIYFTYRIFKHSREKSILYLIFCIYSCTQIPFSVPLNVDNNLIYLIILMVLIQLEYYEVRKINNQNVRTVLPTHYLRYINTD
ncbi:Lipid A core - O-antigen ligase [Anoxybacillus ayderensis]|uniref:Lipid A core-O-antigen ligase n=1 Tax=Anoxybacillus ayderensis TaxID=265546 RepID=A0A0D0HT05_9BACL|nr:O-antigen ligase family protein [Anoxybacillus ayderensis]KIP21008.1 Lipid A core - O-antigen ligase [Anoxybacillus ayderensis]